MRKLKPIPLLTGLAMACIFLSNCKDLKKNYTVKGRLLHSCDNPVPVKNVEVDLYGSCKGPIEGATTNSDGEFLIDYEAICTHAPSLISLQYDVSFSAARLVTNIRANEHEDLGDIYLKHNGFYVIKIKTNQPYTFADTLFYDVTKFRTGPFIDGMIIDTLVKTVEKSQNSQPVASVNLLIPWGLKNNTIYHHNKYFGQGQKFYIEPCKKYSEVILDISK